MDASGRITQQQTVLRSDREVRLEIPEELELGQTYSLVVSSNDLSLSARLVKEGITARSREEKKAAGEDSQARMAKTDEVSNGEGMPNPGLTSSRDFVSPFDAEVFAQAVKEVIRFAKETRPEIKVPNSGPTETPLDLDKLSISELQSRFEATFEQDIEFENLRFMAMVKNDQVEVDKILEVEHENSKLLQMLTEALYRRGVKPLIPDWMCFKAAASQDSYKMQ